MEPIAQNHARTKAASPAKAAIVSRAHWPGRFLLLAAALTLLAAAGGPIRGAAPDDPPALTIFCASTLSGYVRDLARAFERSHPGVSVRREASGSLDAIRKVTDLHQPCDILISADWRLLATRRAGIEPWVTLFAANAMALLYDARSAYANEINSDNWYEVVTRPGVRLGHSDPGRDPEGYFTLILWQLTERYYRKPGLAAKLAARCPRANLRPADADLIALVQAGELDYYFGYASETHLGGLRAVTLPPEINLGEIAYRERYAAASVEVGSGSGRRVIHGAPIAYGATLTEDARNRPGALEFLKLMLAETGKTVAARNGLVVYPKALSFDPDGRIPAELRPLVRQLPEGLRD